MVSQAASYVLEPGFEMPVPVFVPAQRHRTEPCKQAAPRRVRRIRPVAAGSVSPAIRQLVEGREFVAPEGNLSAGYQQAKRAFDVLGALALLSLLGPVMLAIYAVLWVTTGGRPVYRQVRIGHLGRPFTMMKFRTMRLDADRVQHTVNNEQGGPVFKNRRDPRITRLGRWLRKTSLDETPQLINVLMGDMSLIGPRPERPFFVNEFRRSIPRYEGRLAVRPGITGLAQVKHKYDESIEDVRKKLTYDLAYVDSMSWATDAKIAFLTFGMIAGKNAR